VNITIFGSGYVGLVSGACFADVGHLVTCVDVDKSKVERLKRGEAVVYEPGLAELIGRNVAENRLSFTVDAASAIASADLIFIAVGTPPDEDGSADLRNVLAVAEVIGSHMTETKIVVNKSTVPVGSAERVQQTIADVLKRRGVEIDFDVCSNPEFLKEGAAIEDFSRAARIVVGTDSERVRKAMLACYAPYNRNHDKMMFMDVRSAELTKYAANAMLATRISFMNEVARIAELVGADVEAVRTGIGSDPRIGYQFLYAGAGYGGSCFPKDVKALAYTSRKAGHEPLLLNAVEAINEVQKDWLFDTLSRAVDGGLAGKKIAVWGLSFKPNTDDMREAPSINLLNSLWATGASVRAFDPQAHKEATRMWGTRPDLELATTAYDTLTGAHALVICTEWNAFRSIDFAVIRDKLERPLIVDGRNLYNPNAAEEAGIQYHSVGRPSPERRGRS
jgi:UDPglucose 6-dehydrogenase